VRDHPRRYVEQSDFSRGRSDARRGRCRGCRLGAIRCGRKKRPGSGRKGAVKWDCIKVRSMRDRENISKNQSQGGTKGKKMEHRTKKRTKFFTGDTLQKWSTQRWIRGKGKNNCQYLAGKKSKKNRSPPYSSGPIKGGSTPRAEREKKKNDQFLTA